MKGPSSHRLSAADRTYLKRFESCRIPPAEFRHQDHIRLAYIYLTRDTADRAHLKFRTALQAFIRHHGVPESKYSETITQAWILAVDHFMNRSAGSASSDQFIEMNPRLLNSEIMLSHYSMEVLFSEDARKSFVEPDLDPIPRHR